MTPWTVIAPPVSFGIPYFIYHYTSVFWLLLDSTVRSTGVSVSESMTLLFNRLTLQTVPFS